MSALSLTNVCMTLQGQQVLKSVTFDVAAGKMVALLGPNGAGKTSAVRALLGAQKLTSGSATIGGRNSTQFSARQRALALSYLPQTRQLAWPIAVREAVALGRFAHGGALGRLSHADSTAIDETLERCDLQAFANRSVASLSGGELARVHIARALVAQTPALIADEPIAALDIAHAFGVLGMLKARAQEGAGVLVILHDLTLASQFCDDVILMHKGEVIAQGTPTSALTPETIARVYGVSAAWNGEDLRVLGPIR
jgi:iron complex transport system ATP-binding protein